MCSEIKYAFILIVTVLSACAPYRKMQRIRSGHVAVEISVPDVGRKDAQEDDLAIDSIRSSLSEGPIIMNAIRDSETGEMVATDVIRASRVTAHFRNVAEREGYVSVGFDVTVPEDLVDSRWRLKISPVMMIQSDTVSLEPLFVTGEAYRDMQMKGYQRYRAFIASILTDTADLVWMGQLEMFLKRNYPETYAMKTDSSIVSAPMAANLFGVTQKEALEHYVRKWRYRHNEWKKSNRNRIFTRFVKDPVLTEGIRLDTVIMGDRTFIYRYEHVFRSRPHLKKVKISLDASLYEKGEQILSLPFSEPLTYYISSLSALADNRSRYVMEILDRRVHDHTKALIDFAQGSSRIDTTLGDNASELRRVKKCIDDVASCDGFVLDSLVIVASCSPEGPYSHNGRLAMERARSVMDYVRPCVPDQWKDSLKAACIPENWKQFRLVVENDSLLPAASVRRILDITEDLSRPDQVERRLAGLSQYRYLREKIYPMLRSVSFGFYLHRAGMVKDTIHTTRVDSAYMSGLAALNALDYKVAVGILRPYRDYNTALAFTSAGYDHSALDVLDGLKETDPKVSYLKALVLSRLGIYDEAMKYFELCLACDPYMEHRANLDPEMSELVRKRNAGKK